MADNKNKPVEIRALGGARAIPPLIIVLFHFSEGHHYSGNPWLDLVVSHGYLWVEFFFALSGFVLIHAYGARAASLLTASGYGAFLKARLSRLYPVHIFMLLAMLTLVIIARSLASMGGYISIYDGPGHSDISAKGFVLSALLMHAWNTMKSLTWNTPSWFVSVEWALCLLFPIFARAAIGAGRVWRGLVFLAVGFAGILYLNLTGRYGMDYTFHNGVLRGIADFSTGIGLGLLYAELKPRDGLGEWVHSLIQLVLVGALLWTFYHAGWARNHRDYWVVAAMLAVIFALSFDRGIVARALSTRIPQTLGAWSYAIYIGQQFMLQLIRILEQRVYPPLDTMILGARFGDMLRWLEPMGLILACIVWGGLLATFIEHPAAGFIKRLSLGKK